MTDLSTINHDPQLYVPGVPYSGSASPPLTDDEVCARAVSVTAGGDVVMFDHGGKLE